MFHVKETLTPHDIQDILPMLVLIIAHAVAVTVPYVLKFSHAEKVM